MSNQELGKTLLLESDAPCGCRFGICSAKYCVSNYKREQLIAIKDRLEDPNDRFFLCPDKEELIKSLNERIQK